MPTTTETFTGFDPRLSSSWPTSPITTTAAGSPPRKADYERLLKGPLEALCVALDERFRARGIPLAADPLARRSAQP